MEPKAPIRLTPEEQKRRRRRSIAIAVTLAALVAIFYLVTMAKIAMFGQQALQRPM